MPDDKTPADENAFNIDGDETTAPGVGATDSINVIDAELEKARNDYLYLRAEFENYKKNVIKERSDLVKYGSERLLVALLSVLDVLDKALESEVRADNLESFVKGVELTRTEFRTIMEKFGVRELECLGQPFDPNVNQALSSEPTDKYPAGHISTVFKKPYKLHDRVVRPGQVVVAVAPGSKSASQT